VINLLIVYALFGVLVGGTFYFADETGHSPYVWAGILWPLLLLLLLAGFHLTILVGVPMRIIHWITK
jgi:hypothetical protein